MTLLSDKLGYGVGTSLGNIFGKKDGLKGVHAGGCINYAKDALGMGPFLGYKNVAVKGRRIGYECGLTLQFATIKDYFYLALVPFPYFGLSYKI